jgi:hypothetical protein
MTGISLHMQWHLTSQRHGSNLITDQTPPRPYPTRSLPRLVKERSKFFLMAQTIHFKNCCPVRKPGTNVMIFKNIFAENKANFKKLETGKL